jgi:hypothetical protein
MTTNNIIFEYDDIIKGTLDKHPEVINKIDSLIIKIFEHFNGLDKKIYNRREDLFIALRLTDGINILNWIKTSLLCGSYYTVLRELRFLLESVCQAYLIDINHPYASFDAKFEVLKAISNIKVSQGTRLIQKIKDLDNKERLKKLYGELSGYVHPSYKERKLAINNVKDVLSIEYDKKLLNKCLAKCEETVNYILQINSHFQTKYLEILNTRKPN